MNGKVFLHRSEVAAAPEEVFRWHARPGALERLVPPWQPVRIVARDSGILPGSRVVLEFRLGPIPVRWTVIHEGYGEDRWFRDVQVSGPFARWTHTHAFLPAPRGCLLEDRVEYELPFGALGLLGAGKARRELDRLFAYRHRTTGDDLSEPPSPPLRILVSGASGLIGSSLVPFLLTQGHTVVRLVRGGSGASPADPQAAETVLPWDPKAGVLDRSRLEGFDAVIHLAGENLAAGRWTPERKARILESREKATRVLADTLASLRNPPRVLVQASAIGIYGNRGDEELTEASCPGSGFLPEVVAAWEKASEGARAAGIRTVALRFGVVLHPAGGVLRSLLPPFRLGLGGPIGSGRQSMSWIAMDDVLGILAEALRNPALSGPVNAVAPFPVTNAEFSRTLARVLGRPLLFRVPAFALRAAFGQMAEETVLASQRALPAVLQRAGARFRFPRLEDALRHLLGRVEETKTVLPDPERR